MTTKSKLTYPSKFTTHKMISYIALKRGIPKIDAKALWEDVFDVINYGVLNGEKVPIGDFGKMYIKIRPETKEKKKKNPLTGGEMIIKAKPESKIPKFTFNKSYKELSTKIKEKKG